VSSSAHVPVRELLDDEQYEAARLAEVRAYARQLAATAPPLSPVQRAELSAILSL
jgi:hypothetical protein